MHAPRLASWMPCGPSQLDRPRQQVLKLVAAHTSPTMEGHRVQKHMAGRLGRVAESRSQAFGVPAARLICGEAPHMDTWTTCFWTAMTTTWSLQKVKAVRMPGTSFHAQHPKVFSTLQHRPLMRPKSGGLRLRFGDQALPPNLQIGALETEARPSQLQPPHRRAQVRRSSSVLEAAEMQRLGRAVAATTEAMPREGALMVVQLVDMQRASASGARAAPARQQPRPCLPRPYLAQRRKSGPCWRPPKVLVAKTAAAKCSSGCCCAGILTKPYRERRRRQRLPKQKPRGCCGSSSKRENGLVCEVGRQGFQGG
mmetsp:Transcript_3527/g.8302  ORF Transcript_3527/g.8302 Transcript_3527/m.8302 type:complete len:311 (-) Transcript_3527:21-953(-)